MIFAINLEGTPPTVETARVVLPYFEAALSEQSSSKNCSDESFRELKNTILGQRHEPKNRGLRKDALNKLDIIKHFGGGDRMDYIFDLYESIRKYDDLCERELKEINKIEIADIRADVNGIISSLIEEIPVSYLENIREKADAMNAGENVVMFTESLFDATRLL